MAQYQFNPFTNNLDLVGTSGGGTPITTVDLDSGSISGATITLSGGTTGLTTSAISATEGDLVGTLNVAHGGTGDASFTAYSVITGGTTSTGALQNVSGVGTSGQVLTSNGAAALPTWQDPSAISTYFLAEYTTGGSGTLFQPLVFDTVLKNVGSAYNNSTGRFTAPSSGLYFFNTAIVVQNINACTDLRLIVISPTASNICSVISLNPAPIYNVGQSNLTLTTCGTFPMSTSDTMVVWIVANSSIDLQAGAGIYFQFSGYKIGP